MYISIIPDSMIENINAKSNGCINVPIINNIIVSENKTLVGLDKKSFTNYPQ